VCMKLFSLYISAVSGDVNKLDCAITFVTSGVNQCTVHMFHV
jgi:hypothetical protein